MVPIDFLTTLDVVLEVNLIKSIVPVLRPSSGWSVRYTTPLTPSTLNPEDLRL